MCSASRNLSELGKVEKGPGKIISQDISSVCDFALGVFLNFKFKFK
jgi:hypothetical protein